jgi:hypothetical protein
MTSLPRFLRPCLLLLGLAACDALPDHEALVLRDEPVEIEEGIWPPPGGTINTAWLGDMPLMRLVPPGSEFESHAGDAAIGLIEVFDGDQYLPVTDMAIPQGALVLTAGGVTYTGKTLIESRWWIGDAMTEYIVITNVSEEGLAPGYQLEHRRGDLQDPLCEPSVDDEHWAYLVEDVFVNVANGNIMPDDGPLLIACASGAVGKAITWGFSPWYEGDVDLALYRTGVRTVMADYCGDASSHTGDGIFIQVSNELAGQYFTAPEASTEAIFGPDGALCLSEQRVPSRRRGCSLSPCEAPPSEPFQAWTKLAPPLP